VRNDPDQVLSYILKIITFSTANGTLDLNGMEVDEKLQDETKRTPPYLFDGYYLLQSNA
jgi:hypothetical protein